MPIPTDTYWNIKRLNWVFAVSAVLLMAVTGWSIIQDYNKNWRKPQRNARAWEAALVTEKIDRESTPEKQERLKQLEAAIAQQEKTIAASGEELEKLNAEIRKLTSDRSNLEFKQNSEKAVLTVAESQLQDAITANDAERVKALREQIAGPRKQVDEQAERLAQYGDRLKELKAEVAERTKAKTELERERTKLTADVDLLNKKLAALAPQSLPAKLSAQIRATPLLQFINPAERVQQVVLPDVQTDLGGFKRVESIDRCTTCHVNIANKDFTEPNLLAFLEEQVSVARKLTLPEVAGGRAADPVATAAKPGPVAMADFWHAWTRELAPGVLARPAIVTRAKAVAGVVGKSAIVTVDGKKLDTFAYDLTLAGDAREQQEAVFKQLLRALLTYVKSDKPFLSESAGSAAPRVVVEIPAGADEKALTTVRGTAMRYVEELATALRGQLDRNTFNLLEDRYRTALVDEVNVERRRNGREALDPSPVYLAHPNLALYVDVDSPHAFEKVGCTSCHDGSGVETDFVLAAHTARPIWVDEKTGTPVLAKQLKPKRQLVEHHGPDLSSFLAAVFPHDSLTPKLAGLHLTLGGDHHATPATQPAEHATTAASAKPQGAHAGEHAAFEAPAEAPADAPPTPYVDPVTGKEGRAVAQLTHWKKYEPESGTSFKDVNHYWDRPMLPPQYLQANCTRCHTDVYDIKDHAPVVHEGRTLFKNMGCVNCHQMDSITPDFKPTNEGRPSSDERLLIANGQRKVGTDLRHITAKLTPAMINTWIWAPKAFRPSTKMPHFFMLENNASDEELRRTRQEARAITEYLVQTATPLPPKHLPPPALKGNPDAGKAVFNNIGCLGCHSNLNDTTATKRGNKLVTVGEQWIVTDLVKGGRLAEKLAAQLGKAPDTKTLTAEAQRIYDGMTYNERQLYALEHLGEKGEQTALPRYADNSPKPVFMHHGPELSGIGTKLTAGGRSSDEARQWLYDWLKEPRHYSEYTVMPRLRLTDQQAVDLAEYLLSMKRSNDAPNDPWTAGLSSPDSAKLIEMTAMFLRSRFSNKTAMLKADEEAELTALATDALKPADPMDKPGAAAAAEKAKALSPDEKRMVFLGKKLISHYGCMSCHAINGAENLTSPCANLSDWGQKTIDKLDFGFVDHHKVESMPNAQSLKLPMVNGLSAEASRLAHGDAIQPGTAHPVEVSWPHVDHSRNAWLTQKLKNTRVYDRGKVLLEPREGDAGKPYDKLKMPTFYLTDREVDAIVTFVISNRDRLISERLTSATRTEQAQRIAMGRAVAEKYNCVNCHQVEQNVPVVQQYYKADEMTTEAPPSLRGEGNKVQHAWLFNFLKNVEPLRPLLHSDTPGINGGGARKIDIRMPSFPLEDGEAAALAAYFAAASIKESNTLEKSIAPVVTYVKAEMEKVDAIYAESPWPGDDWYRRPEFARAKDAVTEWALARGQVNAIQIDPSRNSPADLGRSYRQLLFKARFAERLYDAPYPFVDSPRPELSDDQFKRGESLFYEMQCLKCHVLGDGTAEGAQKNPTAPNLSLTHRRLQRRWVRHWVQEPPIIQTGTAMPPFLTGLSIDSQRGQPWPRSQGGDEAEVKRVESLYGETPDEQANLLLDFLYAAGVRGYTGIQPAAAGALPGITPITKQTAAAATQAATKASTQPAPPPQPLAMHPEYGKPILPGKAPEIAKPADTAVAEKPAAAPAVAGVKLTGKVTFKGTPPVPGTVAMSADQGCASQHANEVADPALAISEKGEVQNVVVSVEGVAGTFPPLAAPAVLDQKGCMYEPHVVAAQVGQPFVVKNSDPFLHNVHSLAVTNPAFNFAQPNKNPGQNIGAMKAPEVFRVKCDVHPWMSAFVHVFEHPFFGVSKADGSFAIENVPPGTYKVTAWHERFGTQTKDVTVEAGKPPVAEFTFSEAAARSNPSPVMKLVTLAMLGAGGAPPVASAKPAACPSCAPPAASRAGSAGSAKLQAALSK